MIVPGSEGWAMIIMINGRQNDVLSLKICFQQRSRAPLEDASYLVVVSQLSKDSELRESPAACCWLFWWVGGQTPSLSVSPQSGTSNTLLSSRIRDEIISHYSASKFIK